MFSIGKSLAVIMLMLMSNFAWADAPPSIAKTDSHSVESKGKINLYRVQVQGLEFGRNDEQVDAEVLVTLDTRPDMVFTLRMHPDSPPINQVIADTLRDAYLSQSPVTLYHQITGGNKKHVKIHMVQLGEK
jgi:hypothetical protein